MTVAVTSAFAGTDHGTMTNAINAGAVAARVTSHAGVTIGIFVVIFCHDKFLPSFPNFSISLKLGKD